MCAGEIVGTISRAASQATSASTCRSAWQRAACLSPVGGDLGIPGRLVADRVREVARNAASRWSCGIVTVLEAEEEIGPAAVKRGPVRSELDRSGELLECVVGSMLPLIDVAQVTEGLEAAVVQADGLLEVGGGGGEVSSLKLNHARD